MATSDALREVFTAGRPLVEQWLDVGEQIAALRDVATNKGLDWSQVKALLKAQIQDERDDKGDGRRVQRIVEKAEFASAYADMLGLANMNEKNYSAEPAAQSYAEAKAREILASQSELADRRNEPAERNAPPASAEHASDESLGNFSTPLASSGAVEGQSSKPSSDASGAKMGGAAHVSPGGAADTAGIAYAKSEQALNPSHSEASPLPDASEQPEAVGSSLTASGVVSRAAHDFDPANDMPAFLRRTDKGAMSGVA